MKIINKKLLIAGYLASVILLVPINSAYIYDSLYVENDEKNLPYNTIMDDTWIKNLDYTYFDTGNSVIQLKDGGYLTVLTGVPVYGWTGADVFKISSNGDIIWEKDFGSPDDDRSSLSVIELSNGTYVITGWRNNEVWLVKIDSGGYGVWQKTYQINSYAEGKEVIQTFDDGFAIVGCSYYDYNRENSVIFLLKTDNTGNEIWNKTFDNELYNYGCSLKQTLDGGYILVGYSLNSNDGKDKLYLLKTDEDGTLLWEKTYDGKGCSKGLSLQITSDNEYIITGCTRPNLVDDYDIWLLMTDEDGTLLWEKTYGGEYNDIGYSVQTTNDGGYIIAGGNYKSIFNCDVILIKTDDLGNKEWIKTTGGAYEDYASSVQQTNDGGYILTGTYHPSRYKRTDAFLIKTDSYGNSPPLSKNIRNKLNQPRNKATYNSFLFSFLKQYPLIQRILLYLIK
jgi:hypothetical protein